MTRVVGYVVLAVLAITAFTVLSTVTHLVGFVVGRWLAQRWLP